MSANTVRKYVRNLEEQRLNRTPIKIVPKAANPLSKKDTLRSAIAFMEWVQRIDSDFMDQRIFG